MSFFNLSHNVQYTLPRDFLLESNFSILDISGTRFSSSGFSCDWQDKDRRMKLFQARNMIVENGEAASGAIFPALISCLSQVDLLDLSGNELANLTLLSSAMSSISFIIQVSEDDTNGNPNIGQIQLGSRNAAQCSLIRRDLERRYRKTLQVLPSLTFQCSCSQGFELKSKGICKPIPEFWQPWRIVLLCVGVMTLSFLLTVMSRFFVRRFRRVQADLELKEHLLSETADEVQALKRAWEIAPSEIQLEVRIDGDSPGAFGEVWRGKWEGITVAVKMLQRNVMDMDQESLEEFYKEIEFMQHARHSNIVRFFGAGQWHAGGVPFFVIELVSNGSLKAFLRGRGDQPKEVKWAQKLSFAADIAKGMAYIHSLGQMHRDLKSGNVLITDQNRAKIADFGTVRLLAAGKKGRNETRRHTISPVAAELTAGKGTPLYMSPEVIRGGEYDQSADVWSFGVLLWEIAAQRSPDLLEQEGKTRGPLMTNLLSLVENGRRMRMDEGWDAWWRETMERCWARVASDRPRFEEIVSGVEVEQGREQRNGE